MGNQFPASLLILSVQMERSLPGTCEERTPTALAILSHGASAPHPIGEHCAGYATRHVILLKKDKGVHRGQNSTALGKGVRKKANKICGAVFQEGVWRVGWVYWSFDVSRQEKGSHPGKQPSVTSSTELMCWTTASEQ